LGATNGRAVAGHPEPVPVARDVSSTIPRMGPQRGVREDPGNPRGRPPRSRQTRSNGVLRGRHLRGGEKRGLCEGPTKRRKGSKLMAVVDGHGIPVAIDVTSASPAEVRLVTSTLDARFIPDLP